MIVAKKRVMLMTALVIHFRGCGMGETAGSFTKAAPDSVNEERVEVELNPVDCEGVGPASRADQLNLRRSALQWTDDDG